MVTEATFQYSHTIGFLANQGRGFNNPVDLARDSTGLLYVLNRAGPELGIRLPYKRVTICTVDEEYLGEFSTGGTDDGELWWPSSLAFDSQDTLFVSDEALNRISSFNREGQFLGRWGVAGSGDGQLDRPSYIACDAEDNLLVADSLNCRIQKFTREGKFLSSWGARGNGPGQFNLPWGIGFDASFNVYVADWRNDRIQKFDAAGSYLAQWGGTDTSGPFNRPAAVAVDAEGNLYVADWGNERVLALDQEGRLLAELRGDSIDSTWVQDYFAANPEEGAARYEADLEPKIGPRPEFNREESANVEKLLWGPTSVQVDSSGRIYIVDSCLHRVQVYQKLG
ncbi:MAG: NHL repeat-containing protein [Dehalococcoidia bacterium]